MVLYVCPICGGDTPALCKKYCKALEDIIQIESETSSATAMRVIAEQALGKEEEPAASTDDPVFRLAHGLTCENFGQKNPYDTLKGEE